MTTTVAEALSHLTLGEPQVFQDLAVFPLVAEAEPGYPTLFDGLRRIV